MKRGLKHSEKCGLHIWFPISTWRRRNRSLETAAEIKVLNELFNISAVLRSEEAAHERGRPGHKCRGEAFRPTDKVKTGPSYHLAVCRRADALAIRPPTDVQWFGWRREKTGVEGNPAPRFAQVQDAQTGALEEHVR